MQWVHLLSSIGTILPEGTYSPSLHFNIWKKLSTRLFADLPSSACLFDYRSRTLEPESLSHQIFTSRQITKNLFTSSQLICTGEKMLSIRIFYTHRALGTLTLILHRSWSISQWISLLLQERTALSHSPKRKIFYHDNRKMHWTLGRHFPKLLHGYGTKSFLITNSTLLESTPLLLICLFATLAEQSIAPLAHTSP